MGRARTAGSAGAAGAIRESNRSIYRPGNAGAPGGDGVGGVGGGGAQLLPGAGQPAKDASGTGGGGGGGYRGGGGGGSGGIYECPAIYHCDASVSPDVGGGGGGGGGSSYTPNGTVATLPADATTTRAGNGEVDVTWVT